MYWTEHVADAVGGNPTAVEAICTHSDNEKAYHAVLKETLMHTYVYQSSHGRDPFSLEQ
jgi:hypothetical protein